LFVPKPYQRKESKEFFEAVKRNDVYTADIMLFHNKYHVYDFDLTLSSPLHWAAKRGYESMVLLLLKNNCDVD
jgi:ankyrin repeat protein